MQTSETVEQLDPTEELSVENVKKKTAGGIFILTFRTILIQFISFFATAFLTIFLEPAQYGVFFIVSAMVNFLAYFSDIGFAASLVQKKENLTRKELNTIFLLQQLLVFAIIFSVIVFTPLIKSVYKLNSDAVYLLWAVSFSLLLSSLKTIPSVLLERRLDFNKLVIPQIIETLVFNITSVYLAWQGYGVTSYTIAVLARGFSGLLSMYYLEPWIPGFGFDKKSLYSLMKFGIPYQANTFLAMIKDDGLTLFLGSSLGPSNLGLLSWAQKWAFAPLRFFMDQVIRVTFPAYSRLQDNKKELSAAVNKSILFITVLVFPTLVLLVILAPNLTYIIPKYEKWRGALTALTLISVTSAFASVTTPLTNMFNAIGKISLTFKLMIMWTSLTWLLIPGLALSLGVNGAALGIALVGSSSIVALVLARKYVDINYVQIVGKPFSATLIMGAGTWFMNGLLPRNIFSVLGIGFSSMLLYFLIIMFLESSIRGMVSKYIFVKK